MSTIGNATCHYIEDYPQAPNVCQLRYVGSSHEYFGRGVDEASTVSLTSLKVLVDWVHVRSSEAKVDHLHVVLKHDKSITVVITLLRLQPTRRTS